MRVLRFKNGDEMRRMAIDESFSCLLKTINEDLGTSIESPTELNNGKPTGTWENLYKCYYNYAILSETPLIKALKE
jgi:hypothetical protein